MFHPKYQPNASVNLHEETLEVGGRGQQWAKGFAKQQQAKALHIPKGRPLASSYITKSSLLVHHMGSHDLFYLMPRGQELVQFNLGLIHAKESHGLNHSTVLVFRPCRLVVAALPAGDPTGLGKRHLCQMGARLHPVGLA